MSTSRTNRKSAKNASKPAVVTVRPVTELSAYPRAYPSWRCCSRLPAARTSRPRRTWARSRRSPTGKHIIAPNMGTKLTYVTNGSSEAAP
jgi:hypothetical protein